ncbi:MAG TPA: ASKHA domain-containing protein [Patescibacteria group bacterium]|nr:ASKHA domain-containing protein [Patescibacteria group bacterium]
MKNTICEKIYLALRPPGNGDFGADMDRIRHALKPEYGEVQVSIETLRLSYKLLRDFDWKLTVTLVQNGFAWEIVNLERGNTSDKNFAYAADLGSTTVILQLIDLNTGNILCEESVVNHQVQFGADILSRIFYVKDNDERLREIQQCTLQNFIDLMDKIQMATGVSPDQCGALLIGGNTTMIHFLLGIDPWFIFYTPYTPAFNRTGFFAGREIGLPFPGLVYCFPSLANYLGGDIISGLLASRMYEKSELALYMDIGTNGEMLLGNDEFLLAGAGAAGPALEGGISKQGMQAKAGAVDSVRIVQNRLKITTIENAKPVGICGSGIVDLLAEMFLEGWIDYSGRFIPEKSERILKRDKEYVFVYAWEHESASKEDLIFSQADIFRFMDTKAAANTMVAFLLDILEITPDQIQRVYMVGAFGTYINIESGITIGLYPDLPRDRFVQLGNGSVKGADRLLNDADQLLVVEKLINSIVYLSLSEAPDFLNKMSAAKFLPHTDFSLYPTVIEKIKRRKLLETHSL